LKKNLPRLFGRYYNANRLEIVIKFRLFYYLREMSAKSIFSILLEQGKIAQKYYCPHCDAVFSNTAEQSRHSQGCDGPGGVSSAASAVNVAAEPDQKVSLMPFLFIVSLLSL
jgi:hypothetical protein